MAIDLVKHLLGMTTCFCSTLMYGSMIYGTKKRSWRETNLDRLSCLIVMILGLSIIP